MERVSVVMAVHNALPYLEEALSSVLSQTFTDLVVIAVDDGSTDGSLEYLGKVTDPRVRVIAVNTRRGAGPARNIGIEMSNSEYVAFMDADDISLAKRLEHQVAYLDRNPAIGAVGTLVSYCTDAGRTGFVPPIALDHDSIRADLTARRHAIVNATLMIRTEVLKRLGGYRIAGYGEDSDFHLRLTEATRVANLNEVLYLYRLNPQSSNLRNHRIIYLRTAHASDCARRRAANQEEISFEDFSAKWSRRPFWNRCLEQLDEAAGLQYRKAMAEVLNQHQIVGYARFLVAAVISPQRVLQWLLRAVRHLVGAASGRRAAAADSQPKG
jgi:glycosyltransferase involved in cell wall biosynthesis